MLGAGLAHSPWPAPGDAVAVSLRPLVGGAARAGRGPLLSCPLPGLEPVGIDLL